MAPSFPLKKIENGHWKKEKTGYSIYNPTKVEIQISKRLPGLQTCFRAELMAIHKTLKIITTKYPNEPAHIFTDCLNCIHVLNTQIKHPTQNNNHADKTILTSMVEMLKNRTQPTTIYKVKAHININGNEQADQLAKNGAKKRYRFAAKSYEFAHTTPFFFQKDIWPGPNKRPDKGPVRCLQTYLIKHDRENNLKILAEQFPNISKWTTNPDIDNDISNNFWSNPVITDSQKTSLLKFRTGQYMGNARKQLFFGIERFPSITCPICNSTDADTWLHVLLKCNHHHIHALRTKRHNKAVWELRKLILSTKQSRCYTLMNAGTFNNNPQENTVPEWLLPCTCRQQRCHYNARFKPDILCVRELPYQNTPPILPTNNLTIQFIEFTYTSDRFSQDTINNKIQKYQPLINNIIQQGWKVDPIIVIAAGARGTTHVPSKKQLEKVFKLSESSVNHTFKEINTIAIQYAGSILLHKRRIENNQAIPTE